MPDVIKITALNASRCTIVLRSTSLSGIRNAKINTPKSPNKAPTKPRPPSKKPNALPWLSVPPQIRVALIIPAQNKQIVVKPQYP